MRGMLTEVQHGHRFLLQGGDCAERFADCEADNIAKKMRILLQMSLVMSWSSGLPMLRVGRMAGQYAKPRSSDTEVVNGKTIPTFRGDCINGIETTDRDPKPERLVDAYFHAAATLNYMRSCEGAGIADLHLAKYWELETSSKTSSRSKQYEAISNQLLNTLRFMDSCHVSLDHSSNPATFFTSHEGLFLPFEAALTRKDKDGKYYCTSAPFLWIGDRTRQLDGAHVEFFSGIQNPVGCKVGPSADPKEMVELVKRLNPSREDGKIILISRFGAKKVRDHLPKFIKAFQAAKLPVIWQCDPMHGNTFKADVNENGATVGYKTRDFDTILLEVQETFAVHKELGSRCTIKG